METAFASEGFETVTARQDGQIIGYLHGATLPADKPWWTSLDNRRPAGLHALAKAGQVFWLRELMVVPEFQNQGLGRKIHDTSITGHAESVTALTCIIDNQPAHDAYLRWGYTVMGEIKHAPESPTYNAMYLPSPRGPDRPCAKQAPSPPRPWRLLAPSADFRKRPRPCSLTGRSGSMPYSKP
ncbi:GNAT family N-acetyltransferase [Streptomyces lushanensis]|uniref:GNAT family N-acetyltransferase n=1 Tax=Streptomyces lushanensis TaxID=1434255 RepID=UPI001B809EDA|nr:GNAT family N-acetyltransferase [Streptomyces lushanensis]